MAKLPDDWQYCLDTYIEEKIEPSMIWTPEQQHELPAAIVMHTSTFVEEAKYGLWPPDGRYDSVNPRYRGLLVMCDDAVKPGVIKVIRIKSGTPPEERLQ